MYVSVNYAEGTEELWNCGSVALLQFYDLTHSYPVA